LQESTTQYIKSSPLHHKKHIKGQEIRIRRRYINIHIISTS
jgi:hypothetical protein